MNDKTATIERQGDGRHTAGRTHVLRIDGVYQGAFDTRRAAVEYAEAHGATVRTERVRDLDA